MDYFNSSGKWIFSENQTGVDPYDVEPLVECNFNQAPFRGFYNDIQRGRMIMMDIPTSDPGTFHNIVVVGYHPDGWLIYMDPETATLHEVSPYGFQGVHYTLTISGCK